MWKQKTRTAAYMLSGKWKWTATFIVIWTVLNTSIAARSRVDTNAGSCRCGGQSNNQW